MTIRSDCFVSVVAPLSNDQAFVGEFVAGVIGVLREAYTNYELVLVDDGSRDATVATVTSLMQDFECIRLIRLSREFGVDLAIAAGLDSVIGDFVVVMLPYSDPPALIPELVRRVRGGAGIAFGVHSRHHTNSWLVRAGASCFNWYCSHVLKLAVPRNAAIFRALSRQAVNALIQIRDRCRYLPILSAQVGYETEAVPYTPVHRPGSSRRRSIRDAIDLAVTVITASSTHPLRAVTWLGMGASALNMLYTGYIIAVYLFKRRVAEGWTTLSLQSAAMFFFVFLILTVLSEYVGQILLQSENRPLYYVLEERSSPVSLADRHRRNVVNESPAELTR